jgi:hypothetical protein
MVVDRIQVRAVVGHGSLRVSGLGLVDRSSNSVGSLLPIHRAKYALVYDGDTSQIYENRAAQPRAFLASRAVAIPPDDWSIVQMTDTPLDPRTTVLLEERPAGTPDADIEGDQTSRVGDAQSVVLAGAPLAEGERAEIVRYDPDHATVRIQAREPRYLVLTDSYYPGWRAWIDGREVEVERANYLFRAVRVPAGEHTVEWRYQPTSLLVGGIASAVALAMATALGAYGLGRTAPVAGRSVQPRPVHERRPRPGLAPG